LHSAKVFFKTIAEIAVLLVALPLIVFAFGAPVWFGALTIYAWLLAALSLLRNIWPGGIGIVAVVVLIVIVWQSKHRH
jgi:hypothetical protein